MLCYTGFPKISTKTKKKEGEKKGKKKKREMHRTTYIKAQNTQGDIFSSHM